MVRLLKSTAFCMTRFIALSPVGSPTSDTMTIMLFVFFSMYSSTKRWVTWFIRGSSLAKWAPGRSTKVRVVSSGPVKVDQREQLLISLPSWPVLYVSNKDVK